LSGSASLSESLACFIRVLGLRMGCLALVTTKVEVDVWEWSESVDTSVVAEASRGNDGLEASLALSVASFKGLPEARSTEGQSDRSCGAARFEGCLLAFSVVRCVPRACFSRSISDDAGGSGTLLTTATTSSARLLTSSAISSTESPMSVNDGRFGFLRVSGRPRRLASNTLEGFFDLLDKFALHDIVYVSVAAWGLIASRRTLSPEHSSSLVL
jgi:hypothetical protein